MINELLFNDALPLPPLTWLRPGLAPATPLASALAETLTPVVISPPSTGEGGSGSSPLVPLAMFVLACGYRPGSMAAQSLDGALTGPSNG
jgi:hypothetical protein